MSAEEAAAEAQEWGPGAVWVTGFAADALEELRCAVCLGYLDQCVTAPCMHRFCQGCVEKWIRIGQLNCPECKQTVKTRRSFQRDARSALQPCVHPACNHAYPACNQAPPACNHNVSRCAPTRSCTRCWWTAKSTSRG